MSEPAQSNKWLERATRVLIGPSGQTAACWQFTGCEGTAFEYPGQGKKERRPGWTHRLIAQEIADSFKGPLDVVGVSMGGAIIANLLAHHCDRIRSAILICSDVVAGADETAEQIAKKRAATKERASAVLKNGMAVIVDSILARWFSPYALRANLPGVRYARDTLLKTDPAVWYDNAMAQVESERVPMGALQAVKQPVTIVGGVHDHASALHNAQRAHAVIRNSRYEVWPTSRMMHLEQPEFVRAIVDRHGIWAPIGNRVEEPIGSCVWLNLLDGPMGSAS